MATIDTSENRSVTSPAESPSVSVQQPRSSDDDAVCALRLIQSLQKFEAETRASVTALLAEKGEAHVQNMLQTEIQRVKKKESELAAVKKKVTVLNREIDGLRMDIQRATDTKAEAERMCKVLQSAMKRREALTAEATREMEEHRQGVKEKVEKSVNDIRERCNERKTAVDLVMEENRQLREDVAKMKEEFDSAYVAYQESWKERGDHAQELLRHFQQVTQEVELLEARLALARRERAAAEEGQKIMQSQLEAYGAKFSDFAEGHSVEDMEKMAAQQREQGEAKIAQLEAEKKEANELRLKFNKETTECRAALAAAKRELQKVERAKQAAEKQCRQAQEKAKKVNEEKA